MTDERAEIIAAQERARAARRALDDASGFDTPPDVKVEPDEVVADAKRSPDDLIRHLRDTISGAEATILDLRRELSECQDEILEISEYADGGVG